MIDAQLNLMSVLLRVSGDDGLPEELQGGETPEAASEGSSVESEAKVPHSEEERSDERHREGERDGLFRKHSGHRHQQPLLL